MDLLTVLFTLAVVGLMLWVVATFVPMPDIYRKILIAVIVLLVLWWVARAMVASGMFLVPRP